MKKNCQKEIQNRKIKLKFGYIFLFYKLYIHSLKFILGTKVVYTFLMP